MWSSKSYLTLCQTLHRAGFRPALLEGRRVARGFADVGFEEFWVLPQGKLVSIVNGVSAPLQPDHEKFFFQVPDADQLTDAIVRSRHDITSLQFIDQRRWVVQATSVDTQQLVRGEGECIPEALARVLLAILDRCPPGQRPTYV